MVYNLQKKIHPLGDSYQKTVNFDNRKFNFDPLCGAPRPSGAAWVNRHYLLYLVITFLHIILFGW